MNAKLSQQLDELKQQKREADAVIQKLHSDKVAIESYLFREGIVLPANLYNK